MKHELMNIETNSEMIFYDNVRAIVPKIDYEDIYIEKDYPRSIRERLGRNILCTSGLQ